MMPTTHATTSAHASSNLWATLVLWLVRPFALLGGTLLNARCTAQGQLQALAIGLTQLLASTLTGCALAAYLAMLQWTQGELPPWSWGTAAWIVTGVLAFDAALNVALNHAVGWRHWLLKLMRTGITVVLSLQASHMLLLLAQAPSLTEPARTVATERFDASLASLRTQADTAAKTRADANQALADHVAKAPSPAAEEPRSCTDARQPVADGDWMALKQQRQATTLCATQTALTKKAYDAQYTAHDATRQTLADTAAAAKTAADAANQALTTRENLRTATVAQLSTTPAVRQAAFEELQAQDPTLRLQTHMTAALALVFELLAMFIKSVLRSRDESALEDRRALLARTNNLHAQVLAHEAIARACNRLPGHTALNARATQLARANHEQLVEEVAVPPITAATYHAWMQKEMRQTQQPPQPTTAMA